MKLNLMPNTAHPRYIEVKNCRENASDTLVLDCGFTQHRRPQEFYKSTRDREKSVIFNTNRLFKLFKTTAKRLESETVRPCFARAHVF
jgi:hypothetical protein